MKEVSKIINKVLKKDGIKNFEEILDQINEMISYTDLEGKIYYLNIAFAEFLGDSKENIIGKKEGCYLPEKLKDICLQNNRDAYKNGFLSKVDIFDGRIFEVFKSKVSFREEKQKNIKIFTVIKIKDC